jgi:PAP2 superfamily
MNPDNLPPWGVMEESNAQRLKAKLIPPAFRRPDGSTATEAEWIQWRAGLVNELHRLLWPKYDAAQSKWTRSPDMELMKADFRLLAELWPELEKPVEGLGTSAVKHRYFFDEEDGEKGPGFSYELYDPGLARLFRDDFQAILFDGERRRIGSLHFQLKAIFQRPRAYQVAFIQKRTDFSCLWAQTGNTPSFISGHCVQAALAGASAFALFGSLIDAASVDVLKQFTVDVGDRRVFAGVHYPSDNLGSWLTSLAILPYVFDAQVLAAVRAFLWDAITKSCVFKKIEQYKGDNGSSPYKQAVDAITALGQAH